MNTGFTPEEIARAAQIVKQATTNSPPIYYRKDRPANINAAVASMQGPGSYQPWLGPESIVKPTPIPQPGFWKSIGKNISGLHSAFWSPLTSFVGLTPGPSGARAVWESGPKWLLNTATGNQAAADENWRGMTHGIGIARQNALNNSYWRRRAVHDYLSREWPAQWHAVQHPVKAFEAWKAAPGTEFKEIPQPAKAPWAEPTPYTPPARYE